MSLTTSSNASSAYPEQLKRKSNDLGWEYGVLADPNNKDRVRCLLCNKEMSGGINRLKQHIARVKGNVASCPKSTKEDQIRCRDALLESKIKKKGKGNGIESLRVGVKIGSDGDRFTVEYDDMEESFGATKAPQSFGPMANATNPENVLNEEKRKNDVISNATREEQITRIKEYICRWAYECAIPFHAFEKDSFKMMMDAIGQCGRGAQLPTRYEMEETYLKKAVEQTKKLMTPYKDEWNYIGCSILADTWFDRKRSVMNMCVNSKLGTVFLLFKESLDEAHMSEHIYECIEACIKEVDPKNVVQVVTDNASKDMGAAKLLNEKRPTIFWTSCATHTLNLMLEGIGGLPMYTKVLTRAKSLTVFIYAHHKTLDLMRHFTKERDIVRPGVTRFASTYLTLQSLADKRVQLNQMFTSDEWEACKFSKTAKGKLAYATVVNTAFWTNVALCLKVFAPLVKVLRMVAADWKPSMGFVYGEIKSVEQEIMSVLGNNKNDYQPVLDIISKNMRNRLDTKLHLTAYLLNPYYLYNNPEIQNDLDVSDAIIDFVDTIYPGDHYLQNHILTVELPMYMGKQEKFSREIANKACEVNDDKFDPANWWENFGASTPQLRKIAIRILSLTSSSSKLERNWSFFEGVHTKKRNRLEVSNLNNLVFAQSKANLIEKIKKRKTGGREVLLANDASKAQDWIVENDIDESESGEPLETASEAIGDDESFENRSSRLRELYEEEFVSEDEEELNNEVEYESDGVSIN